eukprot:5184237-Prymnesium_polylepis.1
MHVLVPSRLLKDVPREHLRLRHLTVQILWPPDAHSTCLGKLLATSAFRGLFGGRAVGDEHDLTLAPDRDADLLALLSLSDLRGGWLAPVASAHLEMRADDRVIERRRQLVHNIAEAIDLASLLKLFSLLLCQLEKLLRRQLLDAGGELTRLHGRIAERLVRLALHHGHGGHLRKLAADCAVVLLHQDLAQHRREIQDRADGLVLG